MAVEAALIVPILLVLALGVVEWSLVLRDQIQLTSLSRSAARTAAALAPALAGSDAETPAFSRQVAASVAQATAALPAGEVHYLLVYRARSDGLPSSGSFTCSGDPACDRFDWDPASGTFVASGGISWANALAEVCSGADVGVYVNAQRELITGIFGSDKELTAHTVMRFEPSVPGACR